MLLEICAYNIQSCSVAEKCGAHRIELCADPAYGGTTPSYGTVTYALEHLSIPVFPMVRPRGGNFMYDPDELAIMTRDILMLRQLGCPGIATGILKKDNTIDTGNLRRIVDLAHPMDVTFHKAFDQTPDAHAALEAIIEAGCKRVLTSGLRKAATDGARLIRSLIAQAGDRIIIMPGGGVRSSNISELIGATGAVEYHSSGVVAGSPSPVADEQEVTLMVGWLK